MMPSSRRRDYFGLMDATITHIGLLMMFLAGILAALFTSSGTIALLAGQPQALPVLGGTVTMDRFSVDYAPSGALEQYRTYLTLDHNGQKEDAVISVNAPYRNGAYQIYAASYGWLSHPLIQDGQGNDLHRAQMVNQASTIYEPRLLTVFLYGFFPDYVVSDQGDPASASEEMKNPRYVLAIYRRDDRLGIFHLEPGQAVVLDDLRVGFANSEMYSVLE